MSVVGNLSRHKNLEELTVPREYPSYQSVATRQAEARENLGMGEASSAELAVLDGATPGTAVASKAMVSDSLNGIGGFRDTRVRALFLINAPAAVNTTATITASQLTNGLITSTTGAAVVGTLPTGTDTQTALNNFNIPGIQTSDGFEFVIVNTGGNPFTLATAAGWTDGGNAFTAIAAGTSATFRARRTAANAFSLYRIS